jgi:hypothetical protein
MRLSIALRTIATHPRISPIKFEKRHTPFKFIADSSARA